MTEPEMAISFRVDVGRLIDSWRPPVNRKARIRKRRLHERHIKRGRILSIEPYHDVETGLDFMLTKSLYPHGRRWHLVYKETLSLVNGYSFHSTSLVERPMNPQPSFKCGHKK